jgi:hypothetical protein
MASVLEVSDTGRDTSTSLMPRLKTICIEASSNSSSKGKRGKVSWSNISYEIPASVALGTFVDQHGRCSVHEH